MPSLGGSRARGDTLFLTGTVSVTLSRPLGLCFGLMSIGEEHSYRIVGRG